VSLTSTGGRVTVTGAIAGGSRVTVAAADDLTIADVTASGAIDARGQALVLGNLSGLAINALAGSTLASGTVTATGGDATLAASGALTASSISATRTVTLSSGGDAQLGAIEAARSILVDVGGTARLGGIWQSPVITLTASDLVMPAGSGLDAGPAGLITLISRNAAGLRIGDGLDGSLVPTTAFSLDNSEWSRIRSGSLAVFGRDGAGAVDILIGKLDVTGPDAGSTIDDPAGSVRFTTGAAPTSSPSGTIRIAGALRATGMRSGNALVFRTGHFQLASDTGSLALLGRGDALSGTLRIEARDVHVATASLLARLGLDPFFAGVEPALDSESAGGNGPVLEAGRLDLTIGRTFYIQRSGTGADPLGFEEPLGGISVRPAGAQPVTVIINGTFRTAAGLVSGEEAWRQFKASGVDLSGFSADSRLNGCLLSAASCGAAVIRGLPDPGIRTLIETVDSPVIDDSPSDPEEREVKSQSAILPPQQVLPIQPDAIPGQIDEPIAGSGNPALMGGSGLQGTQP
jgi:hypothetical protein